MSVECLVFYCTCGHDSMAHFVGRGACDLCDCKVRVDRPGDDHVQMMRGHYGKTTIARTPPTPAVGGDRD